MSLRKVAALLGGGEQKLELGQKPGQVPALFQKPKKLSKKGKKTFNSFKKKFDPSTVANMMGKPLGDTTSYGLTGKKAPGTDKTVKPDIKISPDTIKSLMDIDKANHTKLTEDQGQRMKTGDGVADILAKIVNFMKKSREEVIEQRQISDLQKEEQLAKEKREQDEFLQGLGTKSKTSKPGSSGGAPEPGETPLEVKGTNLESASKATRLAKPETASRIESRNQAIAAQRTKSDGDKGSSLLSNITNKVTSLIGDAASTVGGVAVSGVSRIGSFLKGLVTPATRTAGSTAASTGSTATKVAGTSIAGAAGLTISKETGATSVEEAIRKVGQVVQNDPKPGFTSYGIFGMNSSGSIQSFVKENPQFNLTARPATPEFDNQWRAAAAANAQAMYDAQRAWHKKHVFDRAVTDMGKLLPTNLANDPGVIIYMSDRRNQYGQAQETAALKYASSARTPEEFINKMTEYDAANIDSAFAAFLETNKDTREKTRDALLKGLQKRKTFSLQHIDTSGEKLDKTSRENADGKKDINKSQNSVIINNTQTVLNNRTENRINIFHEPLSTDSSLVMDYQNMAVPYQELKW
jgi:hypothetical protein